MNDPSHELRVITRERQVKAMAKTWITESPSHVEDLPLPVIYALLQRPPTDPLHVMLMDLLSHKQVSASANDK